MQGIKPKKQEIKPRAINFRLMITKPWNVSINTHTSYYVYTHTKAYMKKTGATIKIKSSSQKEINWEHKSP